MRVIKDFMHRLGSMHSFNICNEKKIHLLDEHNSEMIGK